MDCTHTKLIKEIILYQIKYEQAFKAQFLIDFKFKFSYLILIHLNMKKETFQKHICDIIL